MIEPASAYPKKRVQPVEFAEPRCLGCGRMLARLVSSPAHIDCPRCKTTNLWTHAAGHVRG